MARPIDELIVQIKADTRDLQKQLNQIDGKLKTTGAVGAGAIGGTLGGALSKTKGIALGLTGAFVALGAGMSKVAQIGAEFEDLKDSLDTVFGSMDAGDKAMQRVFQFAQTTPFQIETATKAFIALKSAGVEPNNRMLQVFADTASTSVDQLGVFEALIRTVQRSASGGLGLEELNMIMDRGIDVLGILNRELGLTKDEIAKFGATADGAKLITDALIEGLEKQFGGAMESKMDNLSTVTSNMTIAFKQLGDEVFKSGLGNFLKDMASSLTDLATSIAKNRAVAGGRAIGIDFTTPEFTPREDVMQQRIISAEAENLNKILERRITLQESNIRLNNILDTQFERGSRIREMLDEGIITNETSYNALKDAIARNNKELILLQNKEQDILHIQKERTKGTNELTDAEKESLKRKGELKQSATFLANEIDKLRGNTDELEFAQQNLGDVFRNNKKLFEDLDIETLPELQAEYDKLIQAGQDVEESFKESLEPAIQSMSLSFTSDFVNALMEGENALDSFDKFAKNMVSQIVSTFLQLTVVNQILNNIFGLGLPTRTMGEIFGKKAGGGKIQKGTPTIVGERGAEIFVPDSGGTIMNNMNSKNAMGGTPIIVNQSVNFATGVVPTVRAEVSKMMPQIAQVTKGAVAEASVRGGSYRRLLQGG